MLMAIESAKKKLSNESKAQNGALSQELTAAFESQLKKESEARSQEIKKIIEAKENDCEKKI